MIGFGSCKVRRMNRAQDYWKLSDNKQSSHFNLAIRFHCFCWFLLVFAMKAKIGKPLSDFRMERSINQYFQGVKWRAVKIKSMSKKSKDTINFLC